MTPALFADLPRHLIERFEHSVAEEISFTPPPSGRRLTENEYAQSLTAIAGRPDEAVAVYVHLPFCPVRCLYCACHTTVTHDAERIDRYLDSLEVEMDLVTERLGRGRTPVATLSGRRDAELSLGLPTDPLDGHAGPALPYRR